MPTLTTYQERTLRAFAAHEDRYREYCRDGWVSAAPFRSPTVLALDRLGLVETRVEEYVYRDGVRERGRLHHGAEILARTTPAGRAALQS